MSEQFEGVSGQKYFIAGAAEAPPTGSVIEEAQAIIWGDREQMYGPPALNWERVATLWNGYLGAKYSNKARQEAGWAIDPEDACWMMVLLKMSRQMHTGKRDNLVDAIGYIGLIERIQEGK